MVCCGGCRVAVCEVRAGHGVEPHDSEAAGGGGNVEGVEAALRV